MYKRQDEMFAAAGKFVYAVAACYPAREAMPNGENAHYTILPPEWWKLQMEMAAQRNPGVRWVLCAVEKKKNEKMCRVFTGDEKFIKAA